MQLFSNNFKTTLAAAVDNVTTSITVASSVGLPTLGVGDTVLVTLESENRLVVEIVEVIAVVGNVLTVVRGREGTVASSFELGSFVEGRLTAGWLNQTGAKLDTIESGKQNTITGAASSVVTSNLNPNVVVTTDASGKLTHATAISTTELSYLDGVSSNIQTQLGSKQATITGAATTIASSNLTASMALVSDASGKVAAHDTVSATELGYLDGVTSSVQTQLNSKEPTITTLPVSKGGTGASTLTGLVKGNGTTAFTAAVAGTDYVVPSGSITGNAATATVLQTARTINGVSFNGSANITIADSTKIPTTEKGVANGVATLDANGKVVLTQIPDSVLGQLEYMGTHNFTTMPTATQKGQYWIASVAGNGYEVGDWAVYNGTTFDKVDNTDAVSSVAGRTGNVVLTKTDVGLSLVDNTADASKNVATAATWTTARTITIGNTGKSVNGSANVSWSLAEIGAQAAGNYQPLDADLTAIAGLAGTSGLLKKTAANTWALDTSTYLTGNQTITFTGDATGSGSTSVTLALANSGVTAGTYNNSATAVKPLVVDAKGRITGVGTDVTITPAFSSITGKPTTLAGYGITDAATNTHTHSNASTSVAGFMSSADKTKLDGVATGANNYVHPTGDGNLHVPATGTTNNGKVLTAGATAGSLSWTAIPAAPVSSVAGKTGVVTLTKADVGLGNVDDTSDANKPVSTATQTALNAKQNTITGAATTVTTSNLTASMAMVTDASGKIAAHGTVSATELGYLDGVTSAIQTQLNNKAATTHTHAISDVTGLETALDGKLPSSSYTAADVLTKIKTVDGADSGLDADLLDGKNSSEFLLTAKITETTVLDNVSLPPGFYNVEIIDLIPGEPAGHYFVQHLGQWSGSGGGYSVQVAYPYSYASANYFFIRKATNTTWGAWAKVVTSQTDGAGSGLDADTLDGLQASQFLRSDTSGTMSGELTMNNTISYNDVSRYWLRTASTWGLYWDTTLNRLEFHGGGANKASVDLNDGRVTAKTLRTGNDTTGFDITHNSTTKSLDFNFVG